MKTFEQIREEEKEDWEAFKYLIKWIGGSFAIWFIWVIFLWVIS